MASATAHPTPWLIWPAGSVFGMVVGGFTAWWDWTLALLGWIDATPSVPTGSGFLVGLLGAVAALCGALYPFWRSYLEQRTKDRESAERRSREQVAATTDATKTAARLSALEQHRAISNTLLASMARVIGVNREWIEKVSASTGTPPPEGFEDRAFDQAHLAELVSSALEDGRLCPFPAADGRARCAGESAPVPPAATPSGNSTPHAAEPTP